MPAIISRNRGLREASVIGTSSVDASSIAAGRTKPPRSYAISTSLSPTNCRPKPGSRSCSAPQGAQRQSRLASVTAPSARHCCELGNHLSAFSNAAPCDPHLRSSIRTNSDMPEAAGERATVSPFDVERLARHAAATLDCRLSHLALRVRSHVANPLVQLTLLEKPVAIRTFPAPRSAPLQSRQPSERPRQRHVIPSERVAGAAIPTVAPSRFAGGSSPVSTVTAGNQKRESRRAAEATTTTPRRLVQPSRRRLPACRAGGCVESVGLPCLPGPPQVEPRRSAQARTWNWSALHPSAKPAAGIPRRQAERLRARGSCAADGGRGWVRTSGLSRVRRALSR